MNVGLEHCLFLSVILFLLGLFMVTTRRNGIRILMGVELILNSANLNLIAFTRYLNTDVYGHIFAVFVIILAAAEAAIALAIVLAIYQQFSTVHLEEISSMKH